MRMWMIDPRLLCRKHLFGEHGEIHKHQHNFIKKHKITKRVHPVVQIEPSAMKTRHDQLAQEMIRRKFNHNSPYEMPDISYLEESERNAKVNLNLSVEDLISRCPICEKNFSL